MLQIISQKHLKNNFCHFATMVAWINYDSTKINISVCPVNLNTEQFSKRREFQTIKLNQNQMKSVNLFNILFSKSPLDDDVVCQILYHSDALYENFNE